MVVLALMLRFVALMFVSNLHRCEHSVVMSSANCYHLALTAACHLGWVTTSVYQRLNVAYSYPLMSGLDDGLPELSLIMASAS